jgi:hypothetical protein
MKITLTLWDDQSCISDEIESSLWVMKLNGKDFPPNKDSLMTLETAHKIVGKLLEIEELAADDT